jgi:hypothetical protein
MATPHHVDIKELGLDIAEIFWDEVGQEGDVDGKSLQRRVEAKLEEALDAAWNHGFSWQDLNGAAIEEMRGVVRDGLGVNCTFVDDDVGLIVGLARAAVRAGIADGVLNETLLKQIKDHLAKEELK